MWYVAFCVWLLSLSVVLLLVYFFLICSLINLLAVLHGMWDLSSQTGDQTHTFCTGSMESYPLGHQGSPSIVFSRLISVEVCVSVSAFLFIDDWHTSFVYPFVNWWTFCFFSLLAVMNNATQVLVWACVHFCQVGTWEWNGWHMITLCLVHLLATGAWQAWIWVLGLPFHGCCRYVGELLLSSLSLGYLISGSEN